MIAKSHVVAALAVFFSTAAIAQPPAAPKPGPEHQKMEYYLGTWKMESDVKASPFGPAGKNTGTQKVERGPGGFTFLFHWDVQSTAGAMKGLGVMGYDAAIKGYSFYGADSMGWQGYGKGSLAGKTWTWSTEDHMGDKIMKGRYTATEISPTSYTFKYEMQGDDGKWSLIEDGKATKTK